jgi:hypothetical protein
LHSPVFIFVSHSADKWISLGLKPKLLETLRPILPNLLAMLHLHRIISAADTFDRRFLSAGVVFSAAIASVPADR